MGDVQRCQLALYPGGCLAQCIGSRGWARLAGPHRGELVAGSDLAARSGLFSQFHGQCDGSGSFATGYRLPGPGQCHPQVEQPGPVCRVSLRRTQSGLSGARSPASAAACASSPSTWGMNGSRGLIACQGRRFPQPAHRRADLAAGPGDLPNPAGPQRLLDPPRRWLAERPLIVRIGEGRRRPRSVRRPGRRR